MLTIKQGDLEEQWIIRYDLLIRVMVWYMSSENNKSYAWLRLIICFLEFNMGLGMRGSRRGWGGGQDPPENSRKI